jgi:FtsP/CotA-like multicopper oxidase with cupredoxin domain
MKKLIVPAGIVGALALGMGQAMAANYELCAGVTTKTMPDSSVVTMWGYALATNGICDTPTVPGPTLTVPPGDSTLEIILHNNLPTLNGEQVPVSIVIPGQVAAMTPQFNADGRVRSFTHETFSGTPGTYTWTNIQPGSYAYHSGTHPAVQVQMGLYGAVVKDAAAGEAYPGVSYDNEVFLYYSEIDPTLHNAVANDAYGPGKGTTSTINYLPKFFLVNGEPYTDNVSATMDAGSVGERTLLRMFNMGLQPHAPVLQGLRMQLVAEDGKPYNYARDQYSAFLAAGKTKDAIIEPSMEGTFAVFDRMLNLANDALPGDGGMLSFLSVGAGVPPVTDTVTILRTRYNNNLSQVRVWANSTASTASPPAVLTLSGYGTMDLINNANFDYRLFASEPGGNPGSVSVTSDQGGSDTQAVPYTAPPVAANDAFGTDEDTALNIPAPGVLANDSSGGWFTNNIDLQTVVVTNPTSGTVTLNLDGSFTYTPNSNFNGNDNFTYMINAVNTNNSNTVDTSNTASVNVSIAAINDVPVASSDAFNVNANSTLSVAAPGVLANDTDVEGSALTATLVSGTTNGILTFGTDGSFDYTPNAGTVSDSFSYVANDGGLDSAVTTVNIAVINDAPNEPPVARNDSLRISQNSTVTIEVLANDYDVDGTLDVTSVVIVRPPDNGTAVASSDGTVTYTPNLNYRGSDVFRYTVDDDDGDTSRRSRVRVNVR